MYKALIIDDEAKLRKVLQIKLDMYVERVTVVGMAGDIMEAQQLIDTLKPDLIFLDVAMPGGTGFDLLKHYDPIPFEIIFVTGYNDYILDALRVSAVDYLLKPVITEDLIAAVEKAHERLSEREKLNRYDLLKHNLQHIGDQETQVAIPGHQAMDFVKVKDIIRCEGWQKYTRVYLSEGRELLSSYNLGVFRNMLESYGFFTTHKSHLINTQHIKQYLKEGKVIMADGASVPIARRKKEDFQEQVLKGFLLNKK